MSLPERLTVVAAAFSWIELAPVRLAGDADAVGASLTGLTVTAPVCTAELSGASGAASGRVPCGARALTSALDVSLKQQLRDASGSSRRARDLLVNATRVTSPATPCLA